MIRRAFDAHIIYNIQIQVHAPENHESIEVIDSILQHGTSYILVINDQIIGYALLQYTNKQFEEPAIHSMAPPPPYGKYMFLRDIAIIPSEQRKQHGTKLVRFLQSKYWFHYVPVSEEVKTFWHKQ